MSLRAPATLCWGVTSSRRPTPCGPPLSSQEASLTHHQRPSMQPACAPRASLHMLSAERTDLRIQLAPRRSGRRRSFFWTASAATPEDSADETVDPQVARIQLPTQRRRQRLEFTCNKCGMRSARLVNPEALARGTVFVQCATASCAVWHKITDAFNFYGEEYTGLQDKADSDSDAI